MMAMEQWGHMPPHQWRVLPADDRARIIAYVRCKSMEEVYRREWREKKAKQKEKGVSPYDAMKAQMGLR